MLYIFCAVLYVYKHTNIELPLNILQNFLVIWCIEECIEPYVQFTLQVM